MKIFILYLCGGDVYLVYDSQIRMISFSYMLGTATIYKHHIIFFIPFIAQMCCSWDCFLP